MTENEFKKLNCCLELLAVKDIIADKKKLTKNKLFKKELLNSKLSNYHSEEELNKFIELAKKRKDQLKEIVKNLTELNYTNAIKFAEENKENYIRLYNLHYMNNHNSILCYIRGIFESYLDTVEKVFKKEAKEIFESLVIE